MSPPRAYSPEPVLPIPGDFTDDPEIDQGQKQIPEEEDEMQDLGLRFPKPMEVDCEPTQKQIISDKTNCA